MDRDGAAALADDPLHHRETQAGAAAVAGVGAADADAEDRVDLVRRDAAAAVGDLDLDRAVPAAAAEGDRVAVVGVLDRVLEQAVERHLQSLRVHRQRSGGGVHPPGPRRGQLHRRAARSSNWSRSVSTFVAVVFSPISVTSRRVLRSSLSSSSSTMAASSTVCGSRCADRISSAYPRTTVSGVRISCEASRTNMSRAAARPRSIAASRWTSWSATCRRRTCQTIARKIADISGTSVDLLVGDVAGVRVVHERRERGDADHREQRPPWSAAATARGRRPGRG